MLVNGGADVSKEWHGQTALDLANLRGHDEIATLLQARDEELQQKQQPQQQEEDTKGEKQQVQEEDVKDEDVTRTADQEYDV